MRRNTGSTTCGWCMTGNHDSCRPEIKYFDKVWYCECKTCHSESGVEEKEEETDEEVEEPIQEQEA